MAHLTSINKLESERDKLIRQVTKSIREFEEKTGAQVCQFNADIVTTETIGKGKQYNIRGFDIGLHFHGFTLYS